MDYEFWNEVEALVTQLNKQNNLFQQVIEQKVEGFEKRLDKKDFPITMEKDILRTVQTSIAESIQKVLTSGYSSPLHKLVEVVIEEHRTELRAIISEAFSSVIKLDEFKQSIVNAFSHKVARSIISNSDGLFEKVSNELKQDSVFRSKITIAVSNVVEECLRERK